MVDVVRTPSELLNTLFADGQGAGAITPQDLRDLIVTMFAANGWGDYQDTARTTGSPQVIPALTDTKLLNNAGAKREQEAPPDVIAAGGFWNTTNNSVRGVTPGDGKLITVEFFIRRASGSGDFDLVTFFDIGEEGVTSIPLYQRTQTLPGTGDRKITFTTAVYTLDTWAANGGRVMINTSVITEVWSFRVVCHRLHRGFGTYPPA